MSSGGILQLVATGADTVYLNGDPSITMFKCVYRRHTNFTITQHNCIVKNVTHFDSPGKYTIEKKGDCVSNAIFKIDIGKFNVKYLPPKNKNIKQVLKDFDIEWTNNIGDNTIINYITYKNTLKPFIYNTITSKVTLYNKYFRIYNDILRAINFYNNLNLDTKDKITKKINKIYNDTSFYQNKNSIYLQLDNLNTNIIPNNYKEKFNIVENNLIERNIYGTYDSDIPTNLDEMNNVFTDGSNNILYQNVYNQYMYESGYGMFLLDSSGSYQRDSSGNRISKLYSFDSSGNYIYDGSGNIIPKASNLTPDTQTLSRMFDLIKCYILDVPNVLNPNLTENFVSPIFIRDKMYDEYLDRMILPSIDVSGNYNLKFVYTLFGLLQETRIPSALGFLDKNIEDFYNYTFDLIYGNTNYEKLNYHYTDTSGTIYTKFDSYKLLYRFLNSLSDNNVYDDETIRTIKPYFIDIIYNNLYENYNLYNIIAEVLKNAYFTVNLHFRYGIYNTYTSYITSLTNYQADSRLFTVIQPSSLGLIDNFIDNIKSVLTPNIFFKDDILAYFNSFIVNLGKSVQNSVYNDYLSDQSLWSFLSFNDVNFKSLLQTIKYNDLFVYDIFSTIFNENIITKMAIFNYLPLYLIDNIPRAVFSNVESLGYVFDLSAFDLTDNTYDASGYEMGPTDISFNKTKMYKFVLENVVFSYSIGPIIADLDFITSFSDSYLIDSNKFALFKLVRPEKNYTFIVNDKVYFITNSRAIVEEYRREYYRIISNFTYESGGVYVDLDPEIKIKFFEKVNLVLDNYIRFDFDNSFDSSNINSSTYTTYMAQKKKFNSNLFYADLSANQINNLTIDNNDVTNYIYAAASIYSSLIKQNTEFYNNIMNDICLSKQYYENILGLSMSGLYDKFNELLPKQFIPGIFAPYEYFSYDILTGVTIDTFDTSGNIYPRVEVTYDLSGLNPNIPRQLDYFVYNQTGLNRTIPIINGYDFTDFQNVVIDRKAIVEDPNNMIDTSTNLQNLLLQYDASYNDTRYLLDIQNKFSTDLSFNTVETTVDYYNSFLTSTPSIDVLNNIIIPVKTFLINNYFMCGDMIYNNYSINYDTSNLIDWSIKDIILSLDASNNPFDIILQPNLFESYLYNVPYKTTINTMYDKLSINIIDLLYKDLNRFKLYGDFNTKISLLEYYKNYLINNGEATYLLRYDDETIDIYNTYILKYILDNKNIYYKQIIRILYYNGILPTNEEIIYLNQNVSPYFPIQNLIPQTKLFESSQLDVVLSGMIFNTTPLYSWVKELGYYIFESINLEINNDIFERHNPNLLSLMKKLFIKNTQKRGLDELIGNSEKLYTYDTTDKSNITLYVPLKFWFSNNNTYNSLPLTNILYSDVNFSFKLKNILDLLIIAPYAYIEKEPKIKCSFILDYVYLEQEERLRIAASKLEFLVDKYNYGGIYSYKYNNIINKRINTKLYFADPTKFLLWRIKIKNNDKLNWNKNGYEIVLYKTVNYRNDFTNTDFVTYYPYTENINIIKKTKINFNGNLRQEGDSIYFNSVVPYECGLGGLDKGEYMYSFSLFPGLLQPSGTANLSLIEDLSFEHELTDDVINRMNNDGLELEIEYWSLSYQVLRVMSGFIAPAFIAQK